MNARDAWGQVAHDLRVLAASIDAAIEPASAREADIPLKPQVDRGLGVCPTHGVSWTVKAGGISKNNKAYSAFWRCNEKDGDGFCKERPQKIWADTHPAERAA